MRPACIALNLLVRNVALSRSRSRRESRREDVVPIHLQTLRGSIGEWMAADAAMFGGQR